MNNKNLVMAVITTFIPVYFAIASMIVDFDIIDLGYLICISIFLIRYYLKKRKA